MSSTTKWEWKGNHQLAFDKTKEVLSKKVLPTYPDFNKPFDVHTDASDTKLGAVIKQDKIPIVFYSRKIDRAQLNYTTMEKELLSIVKIFKEYRNILLVHTI